VHLVLMVYFGVGWSRLLVHQVLWLDGFVDEVEDPPMNREVQLHASVPTTLRGRVNRHGRLRRCLLVDLKSREAHPPIHAHLHMCRPIPHGHAGRTRPKGSESVRHPLLG
jgi:hypothetical protein